jgi:methionine-S-sulfoxide reductase
VVRTRVGYTGGGTRNPTYHNLGDHTETLELDFDPAVTSYERLLEAFWSSHDPTRPAWNRQYMAAIFYHDPEQERLARETADRAGRQIRGEVNTQILPAEVFYVAEDYHQKYYLQNARPLMSEFRRMYPHLPDVIRSTAATRVNGYLAGAGSPEALEADLPGFNLSAVAEERLRAVVQAAAEARRRWGR